MANISHFLVCTIDNIENLRYTNILNCSFHEFPIGLFSVKWGDKERDKASGGAIFCLPFELSCLIRFVFIRMKSSVPRRDPSSLLQAGF